LCCGKSILWTLQFLVASAADAAPNSIANVQQQQEAEVAIAAVGD